MTFVPHRGRLAVKPQSQRLSLCLALSYCSLPEKQCYKTLWNTGVTVFRCVVAPFPPTAVSFGGFFFYMSEALATRHTQ